MKRPSKSEIQAKIRASLVEEVAARGIGSVSVGAVAKRAGISPGTIYLHFENKDDMLQKVYLQIKTEFHTFIVAAKDETNSTAMIRRMWFDMFDFVTAYPYDFLFIENAGAAQVLTPEQAKNIAYMQDDITGMLQKAIDDGTLAPLPVQTSVVLLVAPAMHLARTALLNDRSVTPEESALTFERVWIAVSAASPDRSEKPKSKP